MREQLDKSKKEQSFDLFNRYSFIRHMQADWLMWKQYLDKPVIRGSSLCKSFSQKINKKKKNVTKYQRKIKQKKSAEFI